MKILQSLRALVCFPVRILLAGLFLLLPHAAQATNVTVGCPGGTPGGDFTSIQAALNSLDASGPHTITVTGNCAEFVTISDRQRVTLEAPPSQMAEISNPPPDPGNLLLITRASNIIVRRLAIRGGNNALAIGGASDVVLEECTLENNLQGVNMGGNSALRLFSSTVKNNSVFGIRAEDSILRLFGTTVENNGSIGINLVHSAGSIFEQTIIRGHTAQGVRVGQGGFLRISGPVTIQNNGVLGINVILATAQIFGGFSELGAPLPNIIEGHTQTGMQVLGGGSVVLGSPNTFRNNGAATDPFSAGILVFDNGTLLMLGGENSDVNELSNNMGPGILLGASSVLDLNGGALITSNNGDGVRVLRMSAAGFSTPPGFTITGNRGASIFCDDSSLAYGELKGVRKVDCKQTAGPLGRPKFEQDDGDDGNDGG